MRIQVERDADRRVSETLRGDLRMHAISQELGRVRVAQIMESDARQFFQPPHEASELVSQAQRLVRLAVGAGAHKSFAALPDPEREQFLGLLPFEPAQLLDRISGQRDGTVPVVLGRLEANSKLCLLEALHDTDGAAL